jgi:hypothetical protein
VHEHYVKLTAAHDLVANVGAIDAEGALTHAGDVGETLFRLPCGSDDSRCGLIEDRTDI